jgi:proteasome lid subunit RPN8/RPN11
MDVITQDVNSARARGAGGILVGKRRNASVAVEAAIPAARIQEHHGEVAFLPEVWERAYDVMLERYRGSRIVGWYHSHPGAGTGFSDYDRRLHSVLFSEAPSVALVVDPQAHQAAWYGWVLDRIAPIDRRQPPELVGQPTKGGRAVLAAAVALGVAVAGAGGYWVGHERTHDRSLASIELRTRLGAEQGRARLLKQRLADMEAQLAAREAAHRTELEAALRRLRAAEAASRRRTFVLRYHVLPGDSLWSLAERFYGHGLAWKRIYRTNSERLWNPNLLSVGQMIQIPIP